MALVTGGGKRIGRAIALTLGRAGADVIVNYNQSREAAQATVREIAALGVRAVALRADVSRAEAGGRHVPRHRKALWPVGFTRQ